MRVITTFNREMYETTGRALLESLRQYLPKVDLLLYSEGFSPPDGYTSIDIETVPEFGEIRDTCREYIPKSAEPTDTISRVNLRWFNWFRKVAAQYDALIRRSGDGPSIFLDADVRVRKTFSRDFVLEKLTSPVGVFQGGRSSIESGVVFWDESHPGSREVVSTFMDLFRSCEFLTFDRWADGHIFARVKERMPSCFVDFAESMNPVTHETSSGHSAKQQIIPVTFWGEYLEHDKGIHWRKGLVPSPKG